MSKIEKHKILWRPFSLIGYVSYEHLTNNKDKIHFKNTTIDEYPDTNVNDEGNLDFTFSRKIYPNEGTVHITGSYEVHKPVYGYKYERYNYRDVITGTMFGEDIIKTKKYVSGLMSEDDVKKLLSEEEFKELLDSHDFYSEPENFGFKKVRAITSYEKKFEKSFESMEISFRRGLIRDKDFFVHNNIYTIKSIKINSSTEEELSVELVCNGYCVYMESNKTYTYDNFVTDLPFLEYALASKDGNTALNLYRLQECFLKLCFGKSLTEADFWIDIETLVSDEEQEKLEISL